MRTPQTPKPPKARQVNCWFTPELLEALDQEAKRSERSRSFLIGKAVEQFVKRRSVTRERSGTRSEGRASSDDPRQENARETNANPKPVKKLASEKAKPITKKSKPVEDLPQLPPYNPLIDFIESKELAKALKAEKKRK